MQHSIAAVMLAGDNYEDNKIQRESLNGGGEKFPKQRMNFIGDIVEGSEYMYLNSPAYKVCEIAFDFTNKVGLVLPWNDYNEVPFGFVSGMKLEFEERLSVNSIDLPFVDHNLEEINDHNHVMHTEIKLPFPLLPRELYLRKIWQQVSYDNYVIRTTSVDDMDANKFTGLAAGSHVVATGYNSVTWIRGGNDGSSCHVAVLVEVNLEGNYGTTPAVLKRKIEGNLLENGAQLLKKKIMLVGQRKESV